MTVGARLFFCHRHDKHTPHVVPGSTRPTDVRSKPHPAEPSLDQPTCTRVSENQRVLFKPPSLETACYTALSWQQLTDTSTSNERSPSLTQLPLNLTT